jgi:hypothetical protein
MARRGRVWQVAVCTSLAFWYTQGYAIPLDKEGDMKLGVRTYLNARVATEDTHNGQGPVPNPPYTEGSKLGAGTFPYSSAGHLRQNRFFIEAELNHDLTRRVKPFIKIKHLAYHFTFRGEADNLYNWGPREYSTAVDFNKVYLANPPLFQFVEHQQVVNVPSARDNLRKLGTDRERVFQAYVEGDVGDLFWRVGRQILSWGETDGFQLLDHINPLDSSFGGFLIPLDERRIPLDMVLGNYYIGDFGPISEMYLEGFYAFDKQVGFSPGTPVGSPWGLPGGNAPSNSSTTFNHEPALTVDNGRGGFQLKFNAYNATFSLAHYYTYFDTPAVQVYINDNNLPLPAPPHGIRTAFNDGQPCGKQLPGGIVVPDYNNMTCGTPVHAITTAPKVQVSGVTTTFAVPQFYSIVRSEAAYFKDEPAFTQGQLDPFLLNNTCNQPSVCSGGPHPGTQCNMDVDCGAGGICVNSQPCDSFNRTKSPSGQIIPWRTTGGRRLRDSFNFVLGIDANQWIRILNPNQTFLISTQFFYKHIFDAASGGVWQNIGGVNRPNPNREVLPVQALDVWAPIYYAKSGLAQPVSGLGPVYITQPADQYLQTLFIGTSYRSGTVSPGLTIFYDWGGAFLYQPSLTLSRDPFRFIVNYSVIDAHTYKGGSGVSLLKDRDNVEFRLEYVL